MPRFVVPIQLKRLEKALGGDIHGFEWSSYRAVVSYSRPLPRYRLSATILLAYRLFRTSPTSLCYYLQLWSFASLLSRVRAFLVMVGIEYKGHKLPGVYVHLAPSIVFSLSSILPIANPTIMGNGQSYMCWGYGGRIQAFSTPVPSFWLMHLL